MSNARKDLKELMDVLEDEFNIPRSDSVDPKVQSARMMHFQIKNIYKNGYEVDYTLESIESFRGDYLNVIRGNSILKSVFNDMLEIIEEVIEEEVESANEELGYSRKTRGLMTRG